MSLRGVPPTDAPVEEEFVDLSSLGDALLESVDDGAFSVATALQCVVCMTHERAMACIPCGHLCLCEGCGKKDLLNDKCPMCRHALSDILKIYH